MHKLFFGIKKLILQNLRLDERRIGKLLGLLFSAFLIKAIAAPTLSVLEILRVIIKPIWWMW